MKYGKSTIGEYIETGVDRKGKKLWSKMTKHLADEGLSERVFLREVSEAIYNKLDVGTLSIRIKALF